ncbi:helix-turn-helix domain-containing protein [Brevibacillus borstelensis]|jgi:DNA-directed RNA polymerase specialized sigma24 family protein|nr:helix-turn-helix domain-containing protein [Brevibacillus borstelensis]NOU53899.1 helix-turn-helix domain-containing protein [Brevibacillus borstelensis]
MKLLQLVRRAKERDDKAMMEIIQMFEPKIRKSLSGINYDMREDYRQEVYIRIIRAVRKYNLQKTPDLIDYINE